MNQIQLDEGCNAKRLVKACEKEGKVAALRFPIRLRQASDPEVLDDLLPRGNPILTVDLGFARDHPENIPNVHPGIIGIGLDDDSIQTMTTQICQRILAQLKKDVSGWEALDVSNSIIDVRPKFIEISHCRCQGIIVDRLICRQGDGWQSEFMAILGKNVRLAIQ